MKQVIIEVRDAQSLQHYHTVLPMLKNAFNRLSSEPIVVLIAVREHRGEYFLYYRHLGDNLNAIFNLFTQDDNFILYIENSNLKVQGVTKSGRPFSGVFRLLKPGCQYTLHEKWFGKSTGLDRAYLNSIEKETTSSIVRFLKEPISAYEATMSTIK